MNKIASIGVRSGNRVIDENVKLLDQVNQLYAYLNSLLPPSTLKQEILTFAENKRREYIEQIVCDRQDNNLKRNELLTNHLKKIPNDQNTL